MHLNCGRAIFTLVVTYLVKVKEKSASMGNINDEFGVRFIWPWMPIHIKSLVLNKNHRPSGRYVFNLISSLRILLYVILQRWLLFLAYRLRLFHRPPLHLQGLNPQSNQRFLSHQGYVQSLQ